MPRSSDRQILTRLNTTEAIEIARKWVDRYAAGDPGFRGAHLMGGITRAAPDAGFAISETRGAAS